MKPTTPNQGTQRHSVVGGCQLKKHHLKICRVNWRKGFLLRNPSFNYNAFKLAKKLNFDVVFSHGAIATLFGSLLNKPLVAMPHGIACEQPQYNFMVKYLLKKIERIAYERASTVIFLSKQEKRNFEKALGFKPKKYSIIPPGIDFKKFSKPSPINLQFVKRFKRTHNKGVFYIIYTGRLSAVKGIDYLLEAMTKTNNLNTHLLVVGDGPERAALERKAKEFKLYYRVIFLGNKKRELIPDILALGDCFVLPSLSEGFPIALLEAMAAGLPCVVTDIGLPVKAGETALVVPPKDSQRLADAINHLYCDKELRKKLGVNGRKFSKTFSWKKTASELSDVFNSIHG